MAGILGRVRHDGLVAQRPAPADLIVHNAVIYTVSAVQPKARALAIRGDRIAVVGSDEAALALRGAPTRVMDAEGRTVLPGLHDAHGHFAGLGASLQQINLRGTTSFEDILAKVESPRATARPGEWILGRSWDQNDWPDKQWPTGAALDTAAPANPVYLTRVDGHAALANDGALDAAGLTAKTQDPPGGRLIRDPTAHPSGVLVDRARGSWDGMIPPPSPRDRRAGAARRRRMPPPGPDDGARRRRGGLVDVYKRLIDSASCRRASTSCCGCRSRAAAVFRPGPSSATADIVSTCAPSRSARTARSARAARRCSSPTRRARHEGLLTTTPDEIHAMTLAAAKPGSRPASTPSAIARTAMTMDVFEQVEKEVPAARGAAAAQRARADPRRRRDSALQGARRDRLDAAHALHVRHAVGARAHRRARARRKARMCGEAARRRARASRPAPTSRSRANPLLGFYAAITRQDPSGQPPEGWAPEERLTREERCASSRSTPPTRARRGPDRVARSRASWPTSSCCPATS